MKSETKICQNCKQDFTIEPEDFIFYQKIAVPAPTFCPECRMVRRMNFRNEHALYKRKCDATGKDIISMFCPEGPFKVYEHAYWWSDDWDPRDYGKEFDFSKPFFEQYRELLESVPLPNLANSNVINSEYGNHNADLKNCYLLYASYGAENVSYAQGVMNVKDSLDLYTVTDSERCYEDVLCAKIYKTFYSYDTDDSIGSSFLRSCKNLNNSLACVNLRNKTNHIFNEPYTKEEFEKEIEKLDLGSYKNLTEFRKKFEEFSMKFPRRFASILKSTNVVGDMVTNSKNCYYCFDVYDGVEDSKYASHAINLKDSYDGYGFGANGELMYEGIDSGINASRYKFTSFAHTYFPLTKPEAEKKGFRWRDADARNYQVTVTSDKLPDHIKDVSDSILSEVIGCEHDQKCNEQCTRVFRIIDKELEFYRKMKLPLPRLCSNCRHYQRIKQRNPLRLWHRKCQCTGEASENKIYKNTIGHEHGKAHCLNEFETSYAPDRPEIIYCENCYNKEVA